MAIIGYETVANAGVGSTLSDFPVLLTEANLDDGASSQFWTDVDTDGYRIRIATANDGTGRIPMEVAYFDKSAKKFQIWSKPSSMTTGTNTIYITLDDSLSSFDAVGDTNGRNAVWNNVYEFMSHDLVTDSTGNYTGVFTVTGAVQATDPLGRPNGAYDFDGVDDKIVVALGGRNPMSGLSLGDEVSIGAWMANQSVDNYRRAFHVVGDSGAGSVQLGANGYNLNKYFFTTTANGSTTTPRVQGTSDAAGTWEKITGVDTDYQNGSGSGEIIYINAAADSSSNAASAAAHGSATASIILGCRNDNTNFYNGILSHCWFAKSGFTAHWVAAEYANQSSPATFFVPQGYTSVGGGSTSLLLKTMQHYYG